MLLPWGRHVGVRQHLAFLNPNGWWSPNAARQALVKLITSMEG
jgi:hypothetical protein